MPYSPPLYPPPPFLSLPLIQKFSIPNYRPFSGISTPLYPLSRKGATLSGGTGVKFEYNLFSYMLYGMVWYGIGAICADNLVTQLRLQGCSGEDEPHIGSHHTSISCSHLVISVVQSQFALSFVLLILHRQSPGGEVEHLSPSFQQVCYSVRPPARSPNLCCTFASSEERGLIC